MDLIADRAPALDGSWAAELLAQLDPAVEGNPGHHLGVGEVASLAPNLPDPLVGLAPCLLEQPEHVQAELPGRKRGAELGRSRRLIEGVGNLAVDIDLILVGGRVAHPHRTRALKPRTP